MSYSRFFIHHARLYKESENLSPYVKHDPKNGDPSVIYYTDHFIKWIMAKYEQSQQKEMDHMIHLGKIKVQLQ